MTNKRNKMRARFIFIIALVVTTFASPFSASFVNALGTPSILSYQGRLADASGNLLGGSGTNYYFTFSIWDNPTVGSGNRLWPVAAPATTTLSVRQGVFNVNIGDTGAGYPDTLDYNFNSAKDIYLQIQVSSDNVTFQTLSPRQRISSAAFARLAGAVSGADTPSSFGTTTPNAGAQVTIEATTTSSIALSIRARLSQVANLLEIKNSIGSNLFSIDSLGGIFTNSTLTATGAVSASSTLAVTGATTLYGALNMLADILPTTDIARSLGTNALRFLNVYSQNIFASSSVVTNATSTLFAAVTASTTNLTAYNATSTYFAATNSSTTNATSTNFFATTASSSNLFTSLLNAVTAAVTGNFSVGTTSSWAKLSVMQSAGSTGKLLDIASTTSATTGATSSILTVLSNGNIGVGNSSPIHKLEVGVSTVNGSGDVTIKQSGQYSGFLSEANANDSYIRFYDDNNLAIFEANYQSTGGYKPLAFFTSNAEKMRLDTSGRLGIGTTSPVSLLSVMASSTAQASPFVSFNSTTSPIFNILTNGNVGIGTSTPGALFAVNGNSYFAGNLTATGTLSITGTSTLATSTLSALFLSGYFKDSTNASGTNGMVLLSTGTSTLWVATSSLGISGGGGSLTGGVNGYLARWTSASTLSTGVFLDDGTVAGVNVSSSSVAFNIQGISGSANTLFNVSTSTGASLFQVLPNGNVTIGTSSLAGTDPAKLTIDTGTSLSREALFISGNINDFYESNIKNLSAGSNAQACQTATANGGSLTSGFISICANSSTFNNPQAYNTGGAGDTSIMGYSGGDFEVVNATANKNMYFLTGGSATSTYTRMTITGSGSVGIGTSTPIGALDVYGNYVHFGTTASIDTAFCASGSHKCLTYTGSDNTSNGVSIEAQNSSNGANAYSFVGLQNDRTNSSGTSYNGLFLNSSGYSSNTFGTVTNVADLLGMVSTDGPILINAASSTGPSSISFATGGSAATNTRMTIDSNGNVGIGTSTPNAMLSVLSSSTSFSSPFVSFNSVSAPIFNILNNGNVGIGTTTPSQPLTVGGSGLSATAALLVTGATGAGVSANGTYAYAGQFNGKNYYYQAANGMYIFWQPGGASYWFLCPSTTCVGPNELFYSSNGGAQPPITSSGAWTAMAAYPSPITITTASLASVTFLTVDNNGNLVTGGSIAASGTLAITGTSTLATSTLSALSLSNYLKDSTNASGAQGMVLLSTGTSTLWTSTSSLGISAAASLSSLTSATQNSTTSNLNNQQVWDWSSLNTGTALSMTGGALSTGSLLSITSSSSALTGTGSLVNIAYTGSGTNGTGSILNVGSASSTNIFNIGANGSVNLGTTAGSALLNINTTSATITIKDVTADFSVAGSVASSSIATSSDQIMLSLATTTSSIGNGATTSNPNTPTASIQAGSVAIQRADGKYLIVLGGAGITTTNIYDPVANTFTAGQTLFTSSTGLAGSAIKTSTGRFLIFTHNGTAGNTYDPNLGSTGTTAALNGSSSAAFLRPDGQVVIFSSNASTVTSLYNPVTNASVVGPVTASNQGQILTTANPAPVIIQSNTSLATSTLVIMGSTNTTNVYNIANNTFAVGPTMTANAGAGMHAFQRGDGKYLVILGGGTNTTNIYDPVANTFIAGPNLSGNAGVGSHSIQRPDGTFLVVHGGTLTTTSIYDPVNNVFNAGPGLGATGAGAGAFSIMRPDGKIVIFLGGNSNASVIYDTSWAFTGSWISEDMNLPKLNINSIFGAKANNEGTIQYYIKTARTQGELAGFAWTPILVNGRITASTTDQWIKIKVVMTRPTPTNYNPQVQPTWVTNTMMGSYDTKNFLILPTPIVYNLTIDNETILRRDSSDFGTGLNTEDASGPIYQNITPGDGGLTLPYRLDYLDSNNGALNNDLGMSSQATPILGAATGPNTLALKLADGKILFVHSNGVNSTTLYDPLSNSTTTGPTLTAVAGIGSNAVRLPNGNFFITLGNASAVTNIYSATSSTFVAGPTLTANVSTSSQMIINPDGTILVIHGGGLTTTSLCNLATNVMRCISGPVTTAAVNKGAMVIQRPDGKWLIVIGNVSTATNYYDPVNKTIIVGPLLSAAAGDGAHAFQRGDGKWVIVLGASATAGTTATSIYDPTISLGSPATLWAGATLSTAAGMGAYSMQRGDGRFQTISGSSSANTNIYNEDGGAVSTQIGAFIAGGVTATITGVGSFGVQLPDGRYLTFGNGTPNANFFDLGWIMSGQYQSEIISTPNLTSSSVLDWAGNADAYKAGVVSAYVRTASSVAAMQTASWRSMQRPGSSINPASGDAYTQVKFVMNRPMAEMPNNERYVSGGNGYVVYNRLPMVPTASIGGMIPNQADVFVKPTITSYKVYDSTKPDIAIYSLNGNNLFRFSSDGSAYTSNGSWNAGGADVAEYFPTDDSTLEPGDLVSVADTNGGLIKKTGTDYDQNILGVVTTAPGVRLGVDITGGTADKQPIALAGRVPVKVSLENGQIKKGDRITSSTVAGIGMKATDQGRVVAVALEDFVPDADGRGTVLAFVGAQEYMGVSFYEKATNGLSRWANLIALNLGQLNIFAKDGNVGIGVANPGARLHVDTIIRVGTENNNGCIENGAGTVISGTCIADEAQFSTSTEIVDVLAQLKGLKMVAFNWSDAAANTLHKSTSTTEYTIIASSTELTLPGLFSTSTDGLSLVDYSRLAFYGIVAVQELNTKVDALADASATMMIINKDGVKEDTFVGKFFKRLTLWLSDSTNGIQLVVAKVFKSDSVDTGMVCISKGDDKTCITKKELDELLLSNKIKPSVENIVVGTSTEEVSSVSTTTNETSSSTEEVSSVSTTTNETSSSTSDVSPVSTSTVSDTPGAVILDSSGVVKPIDTIDAVITNDATNSTNSVPTSIDAPVSTTNTTPQPVNQTNVSTPDAPIPSF